MQVKVDTETMTLKIMDCDVVESMILETANNKTIEVVLATTSSSGDMSANTTQPIDTGVMMPPPEVEISLNREDLKKILDQIN
jgi:hypothetical protein